MKIKGICFLAVILFLVSSCEYDKYPPDKPVEVIANVKFSSDVLPIFNSSCNMAGCHSSNGQSPDLTTDLAYISITQGGLVDTVTVTNSVLYARLIDRQSPMPPSGQLSQNDINIIYSWIKEGAPNN